jgi:hypothetical protein
MVHYRPTGISLIAALSFIIGLLALAVALLTLAIPLPDPLGRFTLVFGLLFFVIAVLYLAVGWGLWELREWARLSAIVISALILVGNLVSGVALIAGIEVAGEWVRFTGVGVGELIWAAIAAFVIYYLARPDVREEFQEQRFEPVPEPTVPAPEMTPLPAPSRDTEYMVKPTPPTAWLVYSQPGLPGSHFPLRTGRNTIGRDRGRCQVTLNDPMVSNEHAAVVFEQGRFVLYDLAATNGTFLNGQRIQRQMLYDGDEIRLGNSLLVFKIV